MLFPLPGHSLWVVGAGINMLEVTLYPNSLGFGAVKQWLIVNTTSSRMPEKEKATSNFYDPLTHEPGRNLTVCESRGIVEGFGDLLLLVRGLLFLQLVM